MKKQEIKLDALKLIAESYGFELVEKKQTAVEWLFLMMNNPNTDQAFANKLFEKAKELEKQQLQEAFEKGQLSTHKLA